MRIVTLPYVFVGGTRAIAEQVNADFNAVATAINTNVRNVTTGPATFYVATNGSDTPGNGLTPASPAATMGFILDLLRREYDLNNQQITIQLANGTYNESVRHLGLIPGLLIPQNLIIQGNMSTPGQVIWSGNPCFLCGDGGGATIQGVTLQSASAHCIESANQSITLVNNVVFGAAPNGSHMFALGGGLIFIEGNYTINGGAAYHGGAFKGGILSLEAPVRPQVTLANTPNFTTAFIYASDVACVRVQATFNGPATGSRSLADRLAIIDIGGQGDTYLPGNAPGTTTNGGVTA